jgi:hypothetical protein
MRSRYLNGVSTNILVGGLPEGEHDATHILPNHRSQRTRNPGMHRGDMYKELRNPGCCNDNLLPATYVVLFFHQSA